jgi:hypothetical protein
MGIWILPGTGRGTVRRTWWRGPATSESLAGAPSTILRRGPPPQSGEDF